MIAGLLSRANIYRWDGIRWPGSLKAKWFLAKDMEKWALEDIRSWQLKKIKALMFYSQDKIPFYKTYFKELGIEINAVRSLDDFAQLPILTKKIIQQNHKHLYNPELIYRKDQTGGSTGEPLHFFHDREYIEWAEISRRWGFHLCGFKSGDKHVFLWGSDIDSKSHVSLIGKMRNKINKCMFINAFNITENQLKKCVSELINWRPRYIFGYASTLGILADILKKENLKLDVDGVQSTAGTLYPSLRKKLEEVFGQEIYNRYGSREVSIIAHECNKHLGLHEFSPNNYIETIDTGNGISKLVVTNLNNKAFPFIRYEIGDFGVKYDKLCKCGNNFPLLKEISGRNVEIIRSPSGKLIDGEFFTHLFYKITGVKQFQVVQESVAQLTIKIIRDKDYDQKETEYFLQKAILQHGDPGFKIKFIYVDRMDTLKSGKMAFVISKVLLNDSDVS